MLEHAPRYDVFERTRSLIEQIVVSDGVPVHFGSDYWLLHVKAATPKKPGVTHCLTLLHGRKKDQFFSPFGWIGLRTYQEQKVIRVELVGANISFFRLAELGYTNPYVSVDDSKRTIHLPEAGGKCFSIDIWGAPVFHVTKTDLYLDASYRGQGWGRLLIQTAAQIALAEGAQRFECHSNTYDTTEVQSREGVSLYERALGKPKIKEEDESWYIDIDESTPTDGIVFMQTRLELVESLRS